MKLECSKSALSEAISNVSKAVAVKSTISALEGIKIKLSDSLLCLTGYDLDLGIKTEVPVTSSDCGEFIINSRLINDIVRKMPEDNVIIEINDNLAVNIKSGMTEYTVSATSSEEYPDIPEIEECESFTVEQALLKNMISQTSFAVATNDTKPILTGELFEIERGIFNLVAIDGYRLAVRTEKINSDKSFKFVVPGKALNEVSRLLKDEEGSCIVHVSKKHIIFETGGYNVISRLLEGEFHNYRNSLPQITTIEAIASTKELISSLERTSLLINDRIKSPVKCNFNSGSLKLFCSTAIGRISDKINIEFSGAPIEIGFNNRYLLDPLKNIEDDKIKLLMNGPNLPLKIVPLSGDSFTFLVLPVRLKND
ncbi:MAG: DNA polymerase III subunit beta [Oscillospiraceae bacterium]|jgi:DNA polymerase-3 subunit beta